MKEVMDVIDIDNDYIYLKTLRTEACGSCSIRNSCNILGSSNELKLKAKKTDNLNNINIGDKVVVELPNVPVVKLSFIAYGLPLIVFLASVILFYLLGFSDLNSFLIGLLCTCFIYIFIRIYDKKKIKNKYLPTIIEKFEEN
ncbi:MAG TPA: SoxR reducing system RseC family protein [Defluviitoga sp.]|nr:SoxR reducing system RseC family protein [Defluviitoga sp.]HOP24035.1 SoxR reducing system RseC family protein [Defluviitoga sp.]HPZ29018.1 SoxR reducing system RseC family protein [Defluviitoga sp.]HQD62357.1 SoxR reducing system RseC family protein [Defluviitoga sp.]